MSMFIFSSAIDPTPALSFMADFCRPPWTLAAWRGERWIETKACQTKQETVGFLSKHKGSMIRFLLGYSPGAGSSEPLQGDLRMACGVALAIPTAKRAALSPPPSAWIEGPGYGVAVWRYIAAAQASRARRAIIDYARRFAGQHSCRAEPLMMVPLPGVNSAFDLVFHEKRRVIDLLSFEDGQAPPPRAAPSEDQDEAFVRGDQAQAGGGLPVIKRGWIPSECITLFLGPPKQGKSLGVAKLASYIVSGGSWEPGGWKPGWWDGAPVAPEARGSVIVCEEEDPRLETLARIKAAIGLPEPALSQAMAKVHVRMLVPDISIPKQLKQITGLAESLGDCRMISFSPFSRALRLRAYTEDAVRDKVAPIRAWVRDKRIAIIAIVHLDDSGRTSGSQVIPRVCRSGIKFESGVMTVALANSAKMNVTLPFRIEEATAMIEGTPIDTARILFK
jgi:hypothetical protein